jgi:hypothetical protein
MRRSLLQTPKETHLDQLPVTRGLRNPPPGCRRAMPHRCGALVRSGLVGVDHTSTPRNRLASECGVIGRSVVWAEFGHHRLVVVRRFLSICWCRAWWRRGRCGHMPGVSTFDFGQSGARRPRHQKPDPASTGIPGFGLEVLLRRWTYISSQEGAL